MNTRIQQRSTFEYAKGQLGDHFIMPSEVMKGWGFAYTLEQQVALIESCPSREKIDLCHRHGFCLFPSPPMEMSPADIRTNKPEYFFTKEAGWSKAVPSTCRTPSPVKWLAIKMAVYPGSVKKDWYEQRRLINTRQRMYRVPSLSEMVWMLTTCAAVRGLYLMPDHVVRTSTYDRKGGAFCIGAFGGGEGMTVFSVSKRLRRLANGADLGISVAMNL